LAKHLLFREGVITMKRKHHKCGVLAIFAFGLIVALSLWAAPALAADGCDCHTADPPTATPAHAPFVADVTDCANCHAGWTVPHPTFVKPMLGFKLFTMIQYDGTVSYFVGGRLSMPNRTRTGINGIVVYLQERAAGASEFSDIGQVTTQHPFFVGSNGEYHLVVSSPAKGTVYRAVAQGAARSTTLVPVSAVTKLKPALEVSRTRGLNRLGYARLGRRVVFAFRTAPAWFTGEKVKLTLKRGPEGHRRVVARAERRIGADASFGTFRWTLRLHKRGEYNVFARWPRTADHPAVSLRDWSFVVR
jgi:hypothetical protein